jgi:hypothetical protein
VSIYQDLVEVHGFDRAYNSVKRYLRGEYASAADAELRSMASRATRCAVQASLGNTDRTRAMNVWNDSM